ncbi:MAG: WD40/YVTN/BNR-like repeat-containing protein [bacterium]
MRFRTSITAIFICCLVISGVAGDRFWSQLGPNIGSVRAIAIDPINPNNVYLGNEDGGGVYKSIDGGVSWRLVITGMGAKDIYTLAIDPVHPNIIYAGTGYSKVYKSYDFGETWSPITTGMASYTINAIVINPANPNIVYAGTYSGEYIGALMPVVPGPRLSPEWVIKRYVH